MEGCGVAVRPSRRLHAAGCTPHAPNPAASTSQADIVQFQILSSDWKKQAYLLSDRTIELHSQFGKHHTIRVPHHGRDLAYQPETCELLVGGEGPDCFRLNLERGCFMAPLATGASGLNTIAVAPTHGMLALGTADGAVQCWDPRQRSLLGAVSPHDSLGADAGGAMANEVTALRFAPGGLQLAVGTASGHVVIYDIRRGAPLLVKDHQYGLPIRDIKYHRGHVVSADAKIIKLWEPDSGKVFTNIQPAADINDVAVCADSGMLFAGLETERLGAYFIPSLGPAPRWCHFLDSLTEEMEEQAASDGMYDDYKFVTREQLEKLRLTSLLGTSTLRPYMHGFFIDARLHAKATSLSQPFAYEQWRKERVAQHGQKGPWPGPRTLAPQQQQPHAAAHDSRARAPPAVSRLSQGSLLLGPARSTLAAWMPERGLQWLAACRAHGCQPRRL